jgi:hypothetical protein
MLFPDHSCFGSPVPGPVLRLDRLVPCPLLLDSLHWRYLHPRRPTAHHPRRYDPLRGSHACRIPRTPLLRFNWPRDNHHPARRRRGRTIKDEDTAPRKRIGRALVFEPGLLCACYGWDLVDPSWRRLGCDGGHFMHRVLLRNYPMGAI